ncbi:MAG TPA: crossover junction endodeoxyribonuclease RuvC [Steroidobacteraceae bacterium]|nr:crossover junction endodeoxyribonuclease RuvC [Steroidobacteraceae bacterium]
MRGLRIKSLDQLGPRAGLTVHVPVGSRVRVLGIDPGSRCTGFGVIDCGGPGLAYIASGAIAVSGRVFTDRLRTIFDRLRDVIGEYQPDEIAIERVFVHKNADSALKLGQARGAALCAVMNGATRVYEYAPRAVKHAITGFGAAEKSQVSWMVRRTLSFDGKLTVDAADALALAICHAQSRTFLRRVAR